MSPVSFMPVVPATGPSALPVTGAHSLPRKPSMAIDVMPAGALNH